LTPQFSDTLIINGIEKPLRSNPLEEYFNLFPPRPNFIRFGSFCRRGYVATWEIKEDQLVLTGIGRPKVCSVSQRHRTEQGMASCSHDHTQLNRLMCGDLNGGPTQMAKILADSLEERKGFDPDDVRRVYLDWWCEDAFDTGPTFAITMGELDRGTDPDEAVRISKEKSPDIANDLEHAARDAEMWAEYHRHETTLLIDASRELRELGHRKEWQKREEREKVLKRDLEKKERMKHLEAKNPKT
jgi:hypothetical protein